MKSKEADVLDIINKNNVDIIAIKESKTLKEFQKVKEGLENDNSKM